MIIPFYLPKYFVSLAVGQLTALDVATIRAASLLVASAHAQSCRHIGFEYTDQDMKKG